MKPAAPGVFVDRGYLWTQNAVPGRKVYGERLRLFRGTEYRHWTPFRSKLSALLEKVPTTPWIDGHQDVLYLGAASGTTVSHVSDMQATQGDGRVFAIEFSDRSLRDLLWNLEPRDNVVPVLADAGRPETYAAYMDRPVGALVQDVAQRHQVDIFLRNLPFLAPDGLGFLFVKARSIDVARPVAAIVQEVADRLAAAGLEILVNADLAPFELDHRAFVVCRKGARPPPRAAPKQDDPRRRGPPPGPARPPSAKHRKGGRR